MTETDLPVQIANASLDIGAITLHPTAPVTWASGFRMPIYNDNRLLLSNADYRQLVAHELRRNIQDKNLKFDLIAGTSTAGISPGTTLADLLKAPFCYIRDKPKEHGLHNRIEGLAADRDLTGKRVLVIEDLVSTGGSSLKAVQAVRAANGTVTDLMCIFNYELPEAQMMFEEEGVKLHSALNYNTLIAQALATNKITQPEHALLTEWRQDPYNWGPKHGFPCNQATKFADKWAAAVERKNSTLCVGLDPAESGSRADTVLPIGASKLQWSLDFIEQISPHAAGIKVNKKYVEELDRSAMQQICTSIHAAGMVAIEDNKYPDIGETNDQAMWQAHVEGFDAGTFCPLPGNAQEARQQSTARDLGLIGLVLMSNPQFEAIKNSMIRGFKGYEYFALQVAEYNLDGMVIGAPSPDNHITDAEVRRVKEITGDRRVLMPGVGAQGGDAQYIISVFGDRVICNVGRAILGAYQPKIIAEKYQRMLNDKRRRK